MLYLVKESITDTRHNTLGSTNNLSACINIEYLTKSTLKLVKNNFKYNVSQSQKKETLMKNRRCQHVKQITKTRALSGSFLIEVSVER